MTPAQCRAARGLLGWSQGDLAKRSRVGLSTLGNFEGGRSAMMAANVDAAQRALESAGVQFIPENGDGPGVRLRKQREDRANLDRHIEHLEGKVAGLTNEASGKPSPAKGMAMLRRGRAKSDLAQAKNKRTKDT